MEMPKHLLGRRDNKIKYLIWSIEHNKWWKPNYFGYTDDIEQAGRYEEEAAFEIVADANINGVQETLVPETSISKSSISKIPEQKEFSHVKMDKLRDACQSYIDYLCGDNFCEDGLDDYEDDIFEKGLELVFDDDIWDFINSKLK